MKPTRKTGKLRGGIPWTGPEKWMGRGIIGFVAAIAVLTAWLSFDEESERTVVAAGADIQLPLKELKPGKLRLVSYAIDGSTTTQVAAQRGQDGILRVAFGSCRSCRRFSHYRWWGQLVCGRCRHAIRLPNPGEQPALQKGCSSVAIPYAIEGDRLVVRGLAVTQEFSEWYRPTQRRNQAEQE